MFKAQCIRQMIEQDVTKKKMRPKSCKPYDLASYTENGSHSVVSRVTPHVLSFYKLILAGLLISGYSGRRPWRGHCRNPAKLYDNRTKVVTVKIMRSSEVLDIF